MQDEGQQCAALRCRPAGPRGFTMARMSKTSRRRFAKSLAAAGAIAPFAVTELLAQTPPPPPPPAPAAAPAPAAPPPTEPSRFGKALTEMVRANYGEHLSEAELEKIDGDFQRFAPYVERFRQFTLVNADEPDFTFASLVERW